jgi:hypothetical protein
MNTTYDNAESHEEIIDAAFNAKDPREFLRLALDHAQMVMFSHDGGFWASVDNHETDKRLIVKFSPRSKQTEITELSRFDEGKSRWTSEDRRTWVTYETKRGFTTVKNKFRSMKQELDKYGSPNSMLSLYRNISNEWYAFK